MRWLRQWTTVRCSLPGTHSKGLVALSGFRDVLQSGPANAYLLAGVYAIFQPGIFVARTVGLAYHLAILGAIFCISPPAWESPSRPARSLIAHLFPRLTGLAPFRLDRGVACALWALYLAAGRPGSKPIFFAGLLAAIALLYRPDLTPAMLFSSGLLLFFPAWQTAPHLPPGRRRWTASHAHFDLRRRVS